MKKTLATILAAVLCCLTLNAQPLVQGYPLRRNHHTHRLPGVNEHRMARLEKMRQANLARRHPVGPMRAQTQPQSHKGLVLLVQFSDTKMKSGAATEWENRFNQQGYNKNYHVGSVRDFFLEQSYGLLSIDFDVVGPLTLPNTRRYYGTAANEDVDDRAAEMVIKALELADSKVNYADYDWDGDGEVDQVYVVYAGITSSTESGYIWPHEWSLNAAQSWGCGTGAQEYDGVYIDTYAVSNELQSSNTLTGIGTACHEFSHCLGYPDFYDTNYSGGTAGQYWEVMDGGSYNGPNYNGEVPSPYTAYERWMAGWIDLIPLAEPCQVKDMPAINEQGVAYIIKNTGNANEYYILENRQQVTFGTGNGGHGLMLWHIDYNRSAWLNNTVNTDKNHQRMTFLPADGKVGDLEEQDGQYYYYITDDDEAGDPYPGSSSVTDVPQLSWFTSERGGTKRHQNLIHGISESADGKISFTYGDYHPIAVPEPTEPTDVYRESFTANWLPVEGAESYNIQFETPTDDPGPATVLAEDFSGFSGAGEGAKITSSIIARYTQTSGWDISNIFGTNDESVRLSSGTTQGYITTPALKNAAGTLIVNFDASYYGSDGSSAVVSVLNGETTVSSQTVSLTDKRATYTCTFTDVPSGCRVKFASTARKKRFYIYNIDIQDMSGTTNVTVTYTGITSTSYTVDPATADFYYYRVQAVGNGATSEWSDWMDVDLSLATSIRQVQKKETADGEVYDLAGRHLQGVQQPRGIFVRNGRKYLKR